MIAHLIGALRHGTKQRAAIKARITAPWCNRVCPSDAVMGDWARGRLDAVTLNCYRALWSVPPTLREICAAGKLPRGL